ncbi:unnamed protein product [Cuscuta campestris]|uniref:Retrotransposon gag domain-containing protein n=1 Tax=Cuscuta campestris TaxID=132261 RepID=A0A484NB76_9ASTE|nr:unnamed protein product [Cuscuta campestris]
MFPGSITTPWGAFTPYSSAWAQFAADPANAQALQGYQQVMAMMQQAGGFMPFAYPGMTPPIMPPPVSTPSTFVPRMVPIRPVNLMGTMNEAAPSNVHEVDEAEQEAARRRKGKAIAKPNKTRDSAFKRLGDKEDGPRKSAKLRLGPEMGRTSAMERLVGSRHAQSRRSRESETIHQDEEEAESQPRASAYTRLSYDEDDLDKIGSVARKLRALEEKVEAKAGAKKHTLAKSPFSARVHAQKLRRKIKLDVEKFAGKEDPNVHLDTFHNAAQMAGCTDAEECLLFFSSLRGRPVEWFNGLPHGKIGSFEKLSKVFRKKYQDNCLKRKKFTYLNTVGQKEKESLTQFLTRWRDEVDKVEEMGDKTTMSLLMNAFRSGNLYTEFCRRPPSSYQEACNTAWEYAEAEVLNKSKRELEEGYTKAVLKEMALKGELREGYATGNKKDPKAHNWTRPQEKDQGRRKCRDNNKLDKEFIEMIVGGLEGGDTASQRKNWARSMHVVVVSLESQGKIKSDSSLVVGHINGNMEAKGEKMQKYRDLARALLKDLTEYVMEQIPRGENTDADLLSKLTKMDNPIQIEWSQMTFGWMTEQFPEDEDRVRKVKLRAPRFQMIDGRLYKRAFGGPLLRCLTGAEAERVIAEVHEGVCAAHQMSRTLAQRIILLGYFWPTMNQDCERYVQKRKIFQVFYKFPGRPATYYHPVSNVIPFARITHNKASVAYPQGNGQVENANCIIVDGIKKRLGEVGTNWLEELPHIIWAYRVTSRRAIGETPFVLTYGCEARLPIEAKIMTFWEKVYEEKGNEEDHLAELNLLEERRMVAEAKMIEYQQAAKAYHDNKVGPRYFQVGDEVLRRREASKPGDGGKLAKKWEGPYRITGILRPGTYKLETMEGRELERCCNSHHLRKFYR